MIKAITYKENLINGPAQKPKLPKSRLMVLYVLIFILITIIGIRLFQLQIIHTNFLRAQGNARTIHTIDIPSFRGVITDRRGAPLAVSTPVDAIWINPQNFDATYQQQTQLAALLGYSNVDSLIEKIQNNRKRGFLYLKRGVTPDISKKVREMQLSGLGFTQEFRRYYPAGKQAAQIIGFTDIDDKGQSGVELSYESLLKPQVGKKRVLEDRIGHWIQDVDYLQLPKRGEDLKLSIDLRIQSMALTELEKAVEKHNAKSGTLVMLDVRTGEILCMVSAPSFNPNNIAERRGNNTRNRAVTDLYEPGSTIKSFSIASALASRKFDPDTVINTHPGVFYLGEHSVKDIRNYGQLSVKDILKKSSNIGISKITIALPSEQLTNTFRRFGLGDATLTQFPGERLGILPERIQNDFVTSTLAFGYGLAVTPLQLAHAYATLANGGIKIPVTLTKQNKPKTKAEQVIPKDVAFAVMEMLSEVTKTGGTGSRASIPGYKTAGKTGTTRVVGPRGYDPNRHIGLFAGVTPVSDPRLATVVIIEEPSEKQYYGGLVAAPVYKNVVSKALHMFNVPPDAASRS